MTGAVITPGPAGVCGSAPPPDWSNTVKNPKLEGTCLIDCIPQTGECPVGCAECFYNGGRFYRTLEEPLLPSLEEAMGKVVRVNSGHDSNLQRDRVLEATLRYPNKFYNTSIARFDLPGPVVYTCNGRRLILAEPPAAGNLMFVRVRTSTWNLDEVDRAVEFYQRQRGIPVVLTFMRYYSREAVQRPEDYEWRKSVLNDYWCIRPEAMARVMARYKGTGARSCGTPSSSLCIDCRNCEFLYWDCLGKMKKASKEAYWNRQLNLHKKERRNAEI